MYKIHKTLYILLRIFAKKFKVEEIENVINMANDLLQSVIEYNKTKNVNKVITICQKYNLSDEEFEVFVAKYAEMKTAA